MSLPQEFIDLLNLDGFIFFVKGPKGKGKTNFALLLAEVCYAFKYRVHIATNIQCESYFIKRITNWPDLQHWNIHTKGKKLYILDESGEHIARMGFMTSKNRQFMDMLQKIRHFDCGFVGIAPSSKRVDSGFLNTDILDAQIKKISMTSAKVVDYTHNDSYFLTDLPRTSIKYNSKDLALFTMEKPEDEKTWSDCCKAAKYYAQTGSYILAGRFFSPTLKAEQVKRLIIDHCKHGSSQFTYPVEDSMSIEKPPTP
jgi:hypothetical protein